MSFRIRKSIKAGPFRFNLSGSGVGVSVGVPGFRVGTGTRGNYVRMGSGGLSYRVGLSSPRTDASPAARRVSPAPMPLQAEPEKLERIESGSVLAMTHESAAGLLDQIRRAAARIPGAPWAAAATLLAGFLLALAGYAGWLVTALMMLGAVGTAWAHVRDVAGRSVVLFYDLEPEAQAAYEELHAAFARLAAARGAWNVEARAETTDRKRNAGAARLVQRHAVRLSLQSPEIIRTNIDVPAIPCGVETLHFFPDRLLVSSPRGIGAVSYDELDLGVESTSFIEEGPVPADARRIGSTWQYVNRGGGPDRRFADNRQLPILLYEQITFTSPSGLNEVLQLSHTGGGLMFRSAVAKLARLARPTPSTAAPLPEAPALQRNIPSDADGFPSGGLLPDDVQGLTNRSANSFAGFAGGTVEHLIVKTSSQHVLALFAEFGLREPVVRPVEALLYAAFPFDALLGVGHFGSSTEDVRSALRQALSVQAARLTGLPVETTAELVSGRLEEYARAAFVPGGLLARDNGMMDLAARANESIAGGRETDPSLLVALFTYFTSTSEILDYGAQLYEMHQEYLRHGNTIWEDVSSDRFA